MDSKVIYGIIGVVVLLGGIFIYSSSREQAPAQTGMETTESTTAMAPSGDAMMDDTAAAGTIVDIAAGNPDFSTLVAAVQAADLAEALSGPGPFTVFAPTNAAFEKLPAGTVESLLLPENKDMLVKILQYHVVSGSVKSTDLTDGMMPATLSGDTVTVGVTATGVTVNTSNVVTADIQADNGVIHVIDTVLMPE